MAMRDDLARKIPDGCMCPRSCLSSIPRACIEEHVLNLREMELEVKDMYVMGALDKVTVHFI